MNKFVLLRHMNLPLALDDNYRATKKHYNYFVGSRDVTLYFKHLYQTTTRKLCKFHNCTQRNPRAYQRT